MRQLQKLIDIWKNLTSGSLSRKIFGAATTVALLTAIVKFVSVFKELFIAWRFGTGDDLEAFLIALLVPSFIINVIANSFNSALVPTYIQVREQEGIKAAQKLFSGASIWSAGILALTIAIVLSTAPLYLPLIASGFSSQKLSLTFSLLCITAPIILLSGIASTWAAVLNAGERFALASVVPVTSHVVGILFLLIFKSWGIYALAGSLLCGAGIEMVVIGAALKRQGISLRPRWYGFDTYLKQVAGQYSPMIVAAFIICSASLVDQSMAAILLPGSVAALNYGNRLIASPISLMSIALSTVLVPYFSKMVANKDWSNLHRTLRQWIGIILVVTVPMTIFFIVFSEPIVHILFERGEFTTQNTHLVAEIQSLYALQIPFYTINILAIRLITSMQLNHLLIWFFGCSLLINISLNYLFMQWIGIKGIALSTSCVYLFSSFLLLWFAHRKIKNNLL
jgi:putative peptidoglycan lipid II flippase